MSRTDMIARDSASHPLYTVNEHEENARHECALYHDEC